MIVGVGVEIVAARQLAVVRRELFPHEIGAAWGPAIELVWEFVRGRPGLWTEGHNVFVYHHPTDPSAPMACEFGVEVTGSFEPTGEVYATGTPAGEAVVAVYRGPYSALNEAYGAIDDWLTANRKESAGHSWEIYGDPTPDPIDTETTVVHLLR